MGSLQRVSSGGDMTTEPEKRDSEGEASSSSARVRLLEREVAVAKQTEARMLESLIHRTKELEQAKIALEEAKLEAATLRQGASAGAAGPAQGQWSVMDLMFGGVDEEINGLRGRLRSALVAEERSREAADDLAAALSVVTMEAKQVKAWLSDAQAELERANAEAGRLEGLLRTAEADLSSVTEQLDGVMSEWKEAAAAWCAREKALLGRAHAAEEDADGARRENAELAELHRAADHENGGLRRALERAVEEAKAANESLEFAGSENSKLRDAIAEKERAMESLRLENESLKASEAAAQGRAMDLNNQLTAATQKAAADGGAGGGEKATAGMLLEKWKADAQGKLSAAAFLDSGRVMAASRKDRMFASISNIAELRSAAAAAAMDDYDYEFDHLDDGRQYGGLEHAMKHRKRRSVLRKFGDFFRRRSLHKSDFAPVL
ncbi:paramyosin-like [Hordeum vulgare subsp. vulgare]|uniref:paramyosin-like n=1 Tax=Hordeum vulgare subsp. vulgare TaxID=112509 RepID=UPI000295A10B|nr:paramyosin-like [Hordeum vulgare subsp. vulgare]